MMLGLAAGDKNRGPFKMSLQLLESLMEAGGIYDPTLALVAYLQWYRQKDIGWDDSGPTASKVFERFLSREFDQPLTQALSAQRLAKYSQELPSLALSPASPSPPLSLSMQSTFPVTETTWLPEDSIFHHSCVVDSAMRGMTGGVNAAHRCAPLSMLYGCYNDQEVSRFATMDSHLTHGSRVSQDCCVVIVQILGQLLMSEEIESFRRESTSSEEVNSFNKYWTKIVRKVADQQSKSAFAVKNALLDGLDVAMLPHLSRGGYCIDALKASIYFVTHSNSFDDGLTKALNFAGPANYCPVLVGAFAGALYGMKSVSIAYLRHWPVYELKKCEKLVESLASIIQRLALSRRV